MVDWTGRCPICGAEMDIKNFFCSMDCYNKNSLIALNELEKAKEELEE